MWLVSNDMPNHWRRAASPSPQTEQKRVSPQRPAIGDAQGVQAVQGFLALLMVCGSGLASTCDALEREADDTCAVVGDVSEKPGRQARRCYRGQPAAGGPNLRRG
ncbi:hypothetical protein SLS62_001039 [Diatrype stigma]|uniref:Uncharacterized protein n=1 Tax=Diatrype stigma TaxID=117547 RepID=A0AAN9YS84_9PEZI